MTDLHFDTALSIAKELYDGGFDFADIEIVGQNLQWMLHDTFWTKVVTGEEVTIRDLNVSS